MIATTFQSFSNQTKLFRNRILGYKMPQIQLLKISGWLYEAIMAISIGVCVFILLVYNKSYANQFDSLSITSMIGDAFAKIYAAYVELLSVAAQSEYGITYYAGDNRAFAGLFVSYFMNSALNQTITELDLIDKVSSYNNELSSKFKSRSFDYMQSSNSSFIIMKAVIIPKLA